MLIKNGFLKMMNKTLPLVTIGIPTYNRADGYLKQTLESAVNQTYSNLEIIVSDNCSTDNTEMLVKSFNYSRIRYFKQKKNIPAIKNFNFCLDQAMGVYFLLLHDDDLIDNDFIEICMKAANYSTDIGIIRTGTRIIDSCGEILSEQQNPAVGLSTEEFFMAFLSRKVRMFLCGSLFNTKRLKEIGGMNSKHQLWVDVLAEIQLIARFSRVDVPDIKASFRKHPSQMTFNVTIKGWCEDALILLDTICRFCPRNNESLREKGMQYFARHSYDIASDIKSPARRFKAYLTVFKMFKYRHIPPFLTRFFKSPLSTLMKLITYTPLYYPLRFIKRRINEVLRNG